MNFKLKFFLVLAVESSYFFNLKKCDLALISGFDYLKELSLAKLANLVKMRQISARQN